MHVAKMSRRHLDLSKVHTEVFLSSDSDRGPSISDSEDEDAVGQSEEQNAEQWVAKLRPHGEDESAANDADNDADIAENDDGVLADNDSSESEGDNVDLGSSEKSHVAEGICKLETMELMVHRFCDSDNFMRHNLVISIFNNYYFTTEYFLRCSQ